MIEQRRVPLLDHGYVALVDSWGSDEAIIEAARMSTAKGFLGWEPGPCPECSPGDEGERVACKSCEGKGTIRGDKFLLKYLWDNKHATPFEMGGMVIDVKAPIFVFREWHRHRTQSYNEMSARYVPLPNENYVPTVERLIINSKTNKQAGVVTGAAELTETGAEGYLGLLEEMYASQERLYQQALLMGVPKELARIHLPVGRYSAMRASANLRNLLGFLTLRRAPGAQWEIRQYADAVALMAKELFPRTYALFAEGK